MLLVNARCGRSRIHGIGLIAREFIRAGTIIWQFQPGFDVAITKCAVHELSECAHSQLLYYAYFDLQRKMYVLSSDDDRFTNHSDDPNTRILGDHMIAARDIQIDDEITCDYRELYGTEYMGFPFVDTANGVVVR